MIAVDANRIADLCRRHHIRELSIFGSALTPAFTDHSDIDLLYEFSPGHSVGLEIITIEQELSEALGGRRVDLVPKRFLNRHMRDQVLATAHILYAEG